MSRRLRRWVHVQPRDADGNPVGLPVAYGPNDDVPDDVAALIVHPEAWTAEDAGEVEPSSAPPAPPAGPTPPPTHGKGSGVAAWRAYAEHIGVTVADDASRDDIVAAVEAHARGEQQPADPPDGQGDPEVTSGEPPRSGDGATLDAWRAYADEIGMEFAEDETVDDLIAACDEFLAQ